MQQKERNWKKNNINVKSRQKNRTSDNQSQYQMKHDEMKQ